MERRSAAALLFNWSNSRPVAGIETSRKKRRARRAFWGCACGAAELAGLRAHVSLQSRTFSGRLRRGHIL
jgi:hypothetical protein